MAMAHFARIVYPSQGAKAQNRVEYITRTGAYRSRAQTLVEYQGRDAKAQTRREDLVAWKARNMPSWTRDDPVAFFQAAERYEGANRVAYTEWRFALPRELSHSQNMDLARDILDANFGTTHPYVSAFHDPPAADGGTQPHIHILWSARTLDGLSRPAAQFFKLWQAKHPERGGAQKDPAFSHMGAVKAARVLYCDIVNLYLEAHGHSHKLHPDRLETRGIERTPERRLDPSDSNAYKCDGIITAKMAEVLAHREARASHSPHEQAEAQRDWQQRKKVLGITDTMPLPLRLTLARAARDALVHAAPASVSLEGLTQEHARLAQARGMLEDYSMELEREAQAEQAGGDTRPVPDQWRTEAVLAAGVDHALPPDAEAEKIVAIARTFGYGQEASVSGGALHVRLHERERERGLGW
jgi:hypothetical protein